MMPDAYKPTDDVRDRLRLATREILAAALISVAAITALALTRSGGPETSAPVAQAEPTRTKK